jgi:hypothetical protein
MPLRPSLVYGSLPFVCYIDSTCILIQAKEKIKEDIAMTEGMCFTTDAYSKAGTSYAGMTGVHSLTMNGLVLGVASTLELELGTGSQGINSHNMNWLSRPRPARL